jgi:hypothetical protein
LESSHEPRAFRAIAERDRARDASLDEHLGDLPALFERASLDAADLFLERYPLVGLALGPDADIAVDGQASPPCTAIALLT